MWTLAIRTIYGFSVYFRDYSQLKPILSCNQMGITCVSVQTLSAPSSHHAIQSRHVSINSTHSCKIISGIQDVTNGGEPISFADSFAGLLLLLQAPALGKGYQSNLLLEELQKYTPRGGNWTAVALRGETERKTSRKWNYKSSFERNRAPWVKETAWLWRRVKMGGCGIPWQFSSYLPLLRINITGISVISHIYQISCTYGKWKH